MSSEGTQRKTIMNPGDGSTFPPNTNIHIVTVTAAAAFVAAASCNQSLSPVRTHANTPAPGLSLS